MKMYQLLVFILIASLMSCDKNAPGKNETFFCQINGKAFRPEKDSRPIGGVGVAPLRTYWYPQQKSFGILANNGSLTIGFNFHYIGNSIESKDYVLTSDSLNNIGFYVLNNTAPKPQILKSSSGLINISKVTNNSISGTFYFICYSNSGEEYKITKGQFNNVEF